MPKVYHLNPVQPSPSQNCQVRSDLPFSPVGARSATGAKAATSPLGNLPNVRPNDDTVDCVYENLEAAQYALYRKIRYKMKDISGAMVPRVHSCGRVRALGLGGSEQTPRITKDEQGRAHWSGTNSCGSVWGCPVCSLRISTGRVIEIQTAMKRNRAAGGICLFTTFTLSHSKKDTLKHTLGGLLEALRGFKALRRVKEIRGRLGYSGSIRALEVRHHDTNGWHPHAHEIWFTWMPASQEEIKAATDELKALWVQYLAKKGFTADEEHGFDLKYCNEKGQEAAGAYIGKWGMELAYGAEKLGKNGSRSPWQILEAITEKWNLRDVKLFKEYMECFTGKAQMYWSPGLKKHFQIDEIDDTSLADREEKEHVFTPSPQEFRIVNKFKLHSQCLDIAETKPHLLPVFIAQFETIERQQRDYKRELYKKIERSTDQWMRANGF